MRQVIDEYGNKVVGLFKKSDGSFIVNDAEQYKKSILERARVDEIAELKDRLNRLETILNNLLILNK
jgi:hypothetical protein